MQDMTLEAGAIIVNGTGSAFSAGSPSQTFSHNLEIVLGRQSPYEGHQSNALSGGLVASSGGSIALHGSDRVVPWTVLATEAMAGSRILHLKQPVDWQVSFHLEPEQ